jgi:hypothetical protein
LINAIAANEKLVTVYMFCANKGGDKDRAHCKSVGLAQPSAVQASLQRYRLHFGNPDISPLGYIFSCTGFTSATPKSARQAFIFINFYLIIA